jgi:hypothetical protein
MFISDERATADRRPARRDASLERVWLSTRGKKGLLQ